MRLFDGKEPWFFLRGEGEKNIVQLLGPPMRKGELGTEKVGDRLTAGRCTKKEEPHRRPEGVGGGGVGGGMELQDKLEK